MSIAVLVLASMVAFEDPPKDVIDFFRSVAATLADADRDFSVSEERRRPRHASEFLAHFDKSMPGYAEFSEQIEAMIGAGEVSTNIDFINTDGNDKKRTLDLDWLLQCQDERPKRAVIQCTIEKRGKKWKITSIAPIDFFKRE
jgi:hypothetical protein